MADKRYRTFTAFYPYYLSEHNNQVCRRLHFTGAVFIAITLGYVFMTRNWISLVMLPVFGYGFGWIGHAFFEKNVPTTSTYPFYSFCAYFVMIKDIVTRRLKF